MLDKSSIHAKRLNYLSAVELPAIQAELNLKLRTAESLAKLYHREAEEALATLKLPDEFTAALFGSSSVEE